ncbi:class I SAM-dependent methyltransferase [Paraburkholderia tropica]|uniref:Methyltransferase domain-containing protein n=1 Tax=Paraburkholderia tropica TaxID=92647 RepID=A0A1A5X4E5_9BURK|nr:class I SAM-dependent methyltransferase [Paraburkholderia tropica]MBB2978672.1 trans-aconitate methyltransferase [Paraburkholderia tropica]OBR47990.1 SAM-dependent methyltransferase [Paraburkholderia tropica]RQN40105.1 class I SAM-dependent methyltransferase [Paraburkholderia tropica]SEI84111.1 Methyltransferase domain-containing protein [Paraburkholderia tropica]
MNQITPFVPDRFRNAAPHYLIGRPAYSPALIRRVAQRAGLDGSQRLLDLGCGPGQLSLAFASWVASAVAIDPEPAMLEVAAQLGAGIAPNIDYRQGSSYDLSPDLGRFHLAVIGRAFHWMDRVDTLARLDALLDTRGAVALFNTTHLDDPQRPWAAQYRDLLDRYANTDAAREMRRSADYESHTDVLARSAFNAIERISVIEYRRVSAEQLKARPLSMSSLSRERLGDQLDVLLADIDTLVATQGSDGWLTERIESSATFATRAELS